MACEAEFGITGTLFMVIDVSLTTLHGVFDNIFTEKSVFFGAKLGRFFAELDLFCPLKSLIWAVRGKIVQTVLLGAGRPIGNDDTKAPYI